MAKFTNETHQVSLTTDEVYTILLLLGNVAGDEESYSLLDKLSPLLGRKITLEEYDMVRFVEETESEDWLIRIEQGGENE